ncbi:MAG: adenine phosphoribosyltransferase [Phycisphaerae bacterium]|nr:adenine phosphoribosyltransferase [Phycisphaerae bacterium]
MNIEEFIRDVPDFPKPGIIFKDITPLLGNIEALRQTVRLLADPYRDSGVEIVTGVESRGFIFGAMLADELDVGFVPIRKPNKLPAETISESYELEYGTDTIEIHADAISPGQKVLMCDDLIATGGTVEAACKLVKKLEGDIVGAVFVVELSFLPGREKLDALGVESHSLIEVNGE